MGVEIINIYGEEENEGPTFDFNDSARDNRWDPSQPEMGAPKREDEKPEMDYSKMPQLQLEIVTPTEPANSEYHPGMDIDTNNIPKHWSP